METIKRLIEAAVKSGFQKTFISDKLDKVVGNRNASIDIRKFDTMTISEIYRYLKQSGIDISGFDTGPFSRLLGEGSSRVAILLSPNKVLKLPISDNIKVGIAQNLNEIRVAKEFPRYTAKPFAYSPDGKWLVTEPVRVFETQSQFFAATGIRFRAFDSWINYNIEGRFRDLTKEQRLSALRSNLERIKAKFTDDDVQADFGFDISEYEQLLDNDWINGIPDMILSSDLYEPDVTVVEAWGKTADGRVVLMDPGATEELIRKYY